MMEMNGNIATDRSIFIPVEPLVSQPRHRLSHSLDEFQGVEFNLFTT